MGPGVYLAVSQLLIVASITNIQIKRKKCLPQDIHSQKNPDLREKREQQIRLNHG